MRMARPCEPPYAFFRSAQLPNHFLNKRKAFLRAERYRLITLKCRLVPLYLLHAFEVQISHDALDVNDVGIVFPRELDEHETALQAGVRASAERQHLQA